MQFLCGLICSSKLKDNKSADRWYKAAIEHDDPGAYHSYGLFRAVSCFFSAKAYQHPLNRLFNISQGSGTGEIRWAVISAPLCTMREW